MSVAKFIPTIWSARLLEHLDKAHVYAALVNRDYEGEIKNFGDKVKINQIGDITIKDYTKGSDIDDPEELTGSDQELVIDQAKYFNFSIDDVDNAQTNPKLMDEAMQRAAYGMNDTTDSWIELGDGSNTKKHVLATYANAVQVFAKWCNDFGLNPLEDGVIISHHEGNQRGIASNHGDVEHIWDKFGLTMDQFRKDVKKAMGGQAVDTVPSTPVDNSSDDTSSQSINPLSGSVKIIYTGDDGLNVRTAPSILDKYVDRVEHEGTFTVVGISADEKWYQLKSGLFITTIPEYVSFKATPEQKQQTAGTGYYRVRKAWGDAGSQIGAFKNQNNAIELCKQNSGYKVFDNDGNEIYPCIKDDGAPFKFRVTIPDLRIRKGPGTTYDYWKKDGSAEYTGKNVFTIVDTSEGPGAKMWGLLKSSEKDRNRWIALDEEYGKRI